MSEPTIDEMLAYLLHSQDILDAADGECYEAIRAILEQQKVFRVNQYLIGKYLPKEAELEAVRAFVERVKARTTSEEGNWLSAAGWDYVIKDELAAMETEE